ncbi:hypothetical protein JST97_13590 [bacterium]|nr:hypothetical protein [bacterium]
MRLRRLLPLGALVGLCIAAPVGADPELPGDPFPDPVVRSPGNSWLRQNGATLYREQYWDDEKLHLWAYPSFFERDFHLRAPRLSYQKGDLLWFDLGTQRDALDPFISPLVVNAARGTVNWNRYRVDAAVGNTSEFNLPLAIAGLPEFQFNSLALSTRLDEFGYLRFSTSGWTPNNTQAIRNGFQSPEASRVVSLDLRPDLSQVSEDLSLWAGYGQELAASAGISPTARRAYGWRFAYQGDSFRLNAQEDTRGAGYGPGHFENFLRGQSNLGVTATAELGSNFELRETYNRFGFSSPIESSQLFDSNSQFFSHNLIYHSDDQNLVVNLGYLHGQTSGLGLTGANQQKSMTAQVQWRPERNLSLVANHLVTDSSGSSSGFVTRNQRDDVLADWAFLPGQRLVARAGYNHIDNPTFRGGGLSWGLGYYKIFDQDRGNFALDFQSNSYGFASRPTNTFRASCTYRPGPRWQVYGDYSFYDYGFANVGRRTGLSLDVAYLIDRHQEIAASYRELPFASFGSLSLPTITNAQRWVGLELRQSYDGPLQAQFEKRLQPSIRVEVMAHAENSEEMVPIENARIMINDELSGKTDAQGRLRVRPPQGPAVVRMDLSESGPYYQLEGSPERCFSLEEGSEEEIRYTAIGKCGIRIITWNDFFSQGKLPMGYVPVPGIPLIVDGKPERTNSQGELELARLNPGEHRIHLDSASLPAGLEPIGSSDFSVQVNPGQAAQLEIPIRGFATLNGQLQINSRLSVPPEGLEIRANGLALGRTDAYGKFSLKAPSGKVRLDVNLQPLPPEAFLVEVPPLDLQPGSTVQAQLQVSLKARLQVQFVSKGKPVGLEGVPLEIEGLKYLYSNHRGHLDFGPLKPGSYKLQILEPTLPNGYRLVHPISSPVTLPAGEDLEIKVEVEKR